MTLGLAEGLGILGVFGCGVALMGWAVIFCGAGFNWDKSDREMATAFLRAGCIGAALLFAGWAASGFA